MQRSGLFLATVVLVLLTLFCMHWAKEFQVHAAGTHSGRNANAAHSHASVISQAEWRYRQSQMHHWRQMVMPMP